MPIEVATYLSSLNSSNPAGSDAKSQGDDHIRLLKAVLKSTFPNATKLFRFPSSAGSQSGTVTLAEDTGGNKIFPAVGNTTFNLPNTPSDGTTFYIIKTDDNTDPVTIDAFSTVLINAAETYTLVKRYQGVKVIYCSTLAIWLALPWFPVVPYYSGGQDIPFSDLAQIAPRRLLGVDGDEGGDAADLAALNLDTILDWLVDGSDADPVQGSILYRGDGGWFSIAPGTDGQVWRTKGAGADPIWGDPVRPATAYAEYTTVGTFSAHIPLDDTIPDISEGHEIFSLAITPKRSTSRIRVRVEGTFASSGTGISMALFKDGGSPAVRARHVANATAGEPDYLSLTYEFAPGSISPITFTVRVGGAGAGDVTVRASGSTAARYFGGVECPTITIEELFQ
jgi:hypothetical protein